MRARWLAAVATTTAAVLGLAGCGDDGAAASDEPVVVEITVEGDEVSPVGERVEVEAGQPIDLEVTADAPGELHIHSAPEQTLEYGEGTETFELAIDRPGKVDVESHELEQVIVQLIVQ